MQNDANNTGATLLRLAEVAERLRVSTRTMRNWLRSTNPPPHFRLNGRALRFRRAEVEQWVERQRAASVISAADIASIADEILASIKKESVR